MTMSYLDTFGAIVAAGTDGLAYGKMTRAMKVHTRSLHTEGVVAAYVGDEAVSLDAEGAVICLTDSGYTTVLMYSEAGLLQPYETLIEQGSAEPKSPARKTRRRKTTSRKSSSRTVPTPSESVEPTNPLKPSNAVRRVAGNTVDQWQKATPSQADAERIESLERKVSALMAVLAS